jgi:cytochrome c oxidase assembly protein subunit 11
MKQKSKLAKANSRVALIAGVVFVAMIGLTFAAAPLYTMFCKATGYGGTTQRAEAASKQVLERTIEVRFDTNVAPGLPLLFTPDERIKTLRIGETGLAFFKVTNPTDRPVNAVATYNVTPELTGLYFKKLECFCFQQRAFAPGETIELPVVFFVDPEIVNNRDTARTSQITLSYTYFDASARPVQTVTAKASESIGRVVATP